jgi:hypothetical protein
MHEERTVESKQKVCVCVGDYRENMTERELWSQWQGLAMKNEEMTT